MLHEYVKQNFNLYIQEGKEYFIRIFAKNEVGFSDPLETEEPFKVKRPAGYTEEDEKEDAKHDETPSLR